VIEPKTREFIAIAIDASCTHMYSPGIQRHVRKALELGASPREILAVLEMVSVLGIHSVALGVPILDAEMQRAAGASRKID
jgi:alkylhydroperoxidase/carboxymuconolactone decarboxylase family protein YurZ